MKTMSTQRLLHGCHHSSFVWSYYAPNWKQPICPWTGKQDVVLFYPHKRGYHSTIKRIKQLIYATTWVNLKVIMLSTYYVVVMCRIIFHVWERSKKGHSELTKLVDSETIASVAIGNITPKARIKKRKIVAICTSECNWSGSWGLLE